MSVTTYNTPPAFTLVEAFTNAGEALFQIVDSKGELFIEHNDKEKIQKLLDALNMTEFYRNTYEKHN